MAMIMILSMMVMTMRNEDGYRITDAWNGVVWFVDHPVKLLTTEKYGNMKIFYNEKDDKIELIPDVQR